MYIMNMVENIVIDHYLFYQLCGCSKRGDSFSNNDVVFLVKPGHVNCYCAKPFFLF